MKKLILYFVLASAAVMHGQENERNDVSSAGDVKAIAINENANVLEQTLRDLNGNEELTPEERVEVCVAIAVEADKYLEENPKPTRVFINMAPPDGGISGKSPEDIEDPELRAQYIEKLERNAQLLEEIQEFQAVEDLKRKAMAILQNSARDPDVRQLINNEIDELYPESPRKNELKKVLDESKAKELESPTK